MVFLVKDDFKIAIELNYLDEITDNDDTLLDSAESLAIEKVAMELDGRYDTDAIFDHTGSARHPLIIDYVARIAVFNLYSRINPLAIPENVAEMTANVMMELKRINRQETTPRGLEHRIDDDGANIDWWILESRRDRNNYDY
jgi:hypothetical protein